MKFNNLHAQYVDEDGRMLVAQADKLVLRDKNAHLLQHLQAIILITASHGSG